MKIRIKVAVSFVFAVLVFIAVLRSSIIELTNDFNISYFNVKADITNQDSVNLEFQKLIAPYDKLITKSRKYNDSLQLLHLNRHLLIDSCHKAMQKALSLQIAFLAQREYNPDSKTELANIDKDLGIVSSLVKIYLSELRKDSISFKMYLKEMEKEFSQILTPIHTFIHSYHGWLKFKLQGKEIKIFIVDHNRYNIQFHLLDIQKKKLMTFENVKKELEKQGSTPLMITNAGMFHSDYYPVGLFIDETSGQVRSLDTSRIALDDNFHMYPNGVFYIDSSNKTNILETQEFNNYFKGDYNNIKMATQSGPMLVTNDHIHTSFKENSSSFKVRSGVGIIDGEKTVFALTIQPESFYQFARMMNQMIGCQNALFLDGAISKMYGPDSQKKDYFGNFGAMISVSKNK